MPVTIGSKPSGSYRDPIALLSDCHRRIESFLGVLIAVAREVRGGPLTQEQREGLETALRYFEQAAPKHTLDEEESLFPRLRSVQSPQVQVTLSQMDALHADHVKADALHRESQELAARWLTHGSLSAGETQQLATVLDQLETLYRRHIAAEDKELFPLAAVCLGPSELEAIGREMAARRGVAPELSSQSP